MSANKGGAIRKLDFRPADELAKGYQPRRRAAGGRTDFLAQHWSHKPPASAG